MICIDQLKKTLETVFTLTKSMFIKEGKESKLDLFSMVNLFFENFSD